MSLEAVKSFVDETISSHKVVVFSKTYCPYCTKVSLHDLLSIYLLFSMEVVIVEEERRRGNII